jgi:DNA polymerase III alpha subunit
MDYKNVNIVETDIDIDTPDRDKLLSLFKHTPAMIKQNNKIKKHNTGVYFHKVPVNPYNGLCSIDYKDATNNGFFKLDILNVSVYKDVLSDEHIDKLLEKEPIWELLQEQEFCDLLFHLKGHHAVCKKMKPDSIIKLAAVLAMIRPSKKYLIGSSWDKIFKEVWTKPKDEKYHFKKSHSISYAITVKLHMNLLCEQFSQSF